MHEYPPPDRMEDVAVIVSDVSLPVYLSSIESVCSDAGPDDPDDPDDPDERLT